MEKPIHDIALAIVHRDGRWLVARRRPTVHLGNAWEFPGGKRHLDETAAEAALRELMEECGVRAGVERVLEPVSAEYEDRVVQLTPVICHWMAGEGQPLASAECRWVTPAELRTLAMPAVNAGVIRDALRTATSEL